MSQNGDNTVRNNDDHQDEIIDPNDSISSQVLEPSLSLQRTLRLIVRTEVAFTRHEKFLALEQPSTFSEARHRWNQVVELIKLVVHESVEYNLPDEFMTRISDLEDRYFILFSKLDALMSELAPMTPCATSTPTSTPNSLSLDGKVKTSVMKTPKLNIPTFDGTTCKWLKFRDLFTSMVHENPNIDAITKFLYLEEAMTIPVGQSNILENFAVSSKNYEAAWKAVCTRYDDKRKILAHHMNGIMSVKKMENSSSSELLRLLDTFESHLSALAQFNYKVENEDDLPNLIFVHQLTTKLHDDTLKEWRKENDSDTPTFKELQEFLRTLWRSLDDFRHEPAKVVSKATEVKVNKGTKSFVANNGNFKSESPCVACAKNHGLWSCSRFLSMNSDERWNIAKSNKLCFICLRKGHSTSDCTMVDKLRCKSCSRSHGSLLHYEKSSSSSSNTTDSSKPSSGLSAESKTFTPYQMTKTVENRSSVHAAMTLSATSRRKVSLMATVAVLVVDAEGDTQLCRALLDSGSDMNFMTTKCAERLMLTFRDTYATVQGIHGQTVVVRKRVTATIESRYGPYQKDLDFSVLPDITGYLPERTLDVNELNIPSSYFLADPSFYESADIDMLLSSSVFFDALLNRKVSLASGPSLVETVYGWIVGGEIIKGIRSSNSYLVCVSNHAVTGTSELDKKIEKFLSADDVPNEKPSVSAEEKFCERLFAETTIIASDGKFVVELPLQSNYEKLGTNLSNARRTLFWQERERMKNSVYDKLYCDYMDGMISAGYMSEIQPNNNEASYYLPHHGILKPTSSSTKLRPVFNGSSKSESGLSLNDVLCVGPTVQPESFDTLLRFREKKFVITGDITKMYLQIWVHPDFRKYQRILWRANLQSPVKHFELNTVTFGLKCSPYLATRCIQQLAMNYANTFPDASTVLAECFYVDDLLFGVASIEEGKKTLHDIRNILAEAGMSLCKISANDKALIENLPPELIDVRDENQREITKTLGVVYQATTDQFSFALHLSNDNELTRAKVYSQIASIYDPLGWIGPVVLTAKLFMKRLSLLKVGWNEKLPDDIAQDWISFRNALPLINRININRHCYIENHVRIELHGFADSSVIGYGATIYALSYNNDDEAHVSLICAKSRVAPANQKTLARLELCAATLLAKLINRTISTFKLPINDVTLWSDSTIVLSWISITPASRLQTFVGNRVAVIQELTHQLTWKHIRGVDNPADVISRGLAPDELENCYLWWNGPSFFKKPKVDWPTSIITLNEQDPEVVQEMKKTFVVRQNDMLIYIETRWSSFRTLVRCVAWMRRILSPTNHQLNQAGLRQLSLDEIESSKKFIVKTIQRAFFPNEYELLMNQREFDLEPVENEARPEITKKSVLHSLTPIMDAEGIIRVGGRLARSPDISGDHKHPIVLPDCHFTSILIREMHSSNLHPGSQALVSIVRETYWPLGLKKIIKRVTRECLICFRAKPPQIHQLMSELPEARVTATPPFTHTALDYAGYYHIRTSLAKKSSKAKAYVVMFKCMCTLAIHLELVSDLSSSAFIAALDRFISRRGLCRVIFSDNATCFVGADAEMKRIVRDHQSEIETRANNLGIEWKFTTPRAPHAGGIYESGIKSTKSLLSKILGKTLLTFEQFTTVLCKVEAVLNSRPLTPLSEDPNDLRALTPGHFLVGRPLTSKPERRFIQVPLGRLDRWEALQHAQQQFWREWHRNYLHTLQRRPINFRDKFEVKVDDLVLIHEPNAPPLRWLMGRIIKLLPGRDGTVRSVLIKTQHGEKVRDIRYLSFLPHENLPFAPPECVTAQP